MRWRKQLGLGVSLLLLGLSLWAWSLRQLHAQIGAARPPSSPQFGLGNTDVWFAPFAPKEQR